MQNISDADLISNIKKWMLSDECPENFDGQFILNVMDNFKKHNKLIGRQRAGLEKVYRSWVLKEKREDAPPPQSYTSQPRSSGGGCSCRCHQCANFKPRETSAQSMPDTDNNIPF